MPCDLTPAIIARLLQTYSHADLLKYSLEVSQRKFAWYRRILGTYEIIEYSEIVNIHTLD